jgi:8-oxo-dGTP pyrophosphatase MutT (NUDIX family)
MNDRNERETRLACFVLPSLDGRVLLARHTYAYSDVWAMVGGMAEPGESIDAAARREVLEETGLEVTTDRVVAVIDRGDLVIFVFEGQVLRGVECAQAQEIAELCWFTPSELLTARVFDLVVQLGPVLTQPRGLAPVTIAFPDVMRGGFAAVGVEA